MHVTCLIKYPLIVLLMISVHVLGGKWMWNNRLWWERVSGTSGNCRIYIWRNAEYVEYYKKISHYNGYDKTAEQPAFWYWWFKLQTAERTETAVNKNSGHLVRQPEKCLRLIIYTMVYSRTWFSKRKKCISVGKSPYNNILNCVDTEKFYVML